MKKKRILFNCGTAVYKRKKKRQLYKKKNAEERAFVLRNTLKNRFYRENDDEDLTFSTRRFD